MGSDVLRYQGLRETLANRLSIPVSPWTSKCRYIGLLPVATLLLLSFAYVLIGGIQSPLNMPNVIKLVILNGRRLLCPPLAESRPYPIGVTNVLRINIVTGSQKSHRCVVPQTILATKFSPPGAVCAVHTML